MNAAFKVISSNPNSKGGFVTKLQRETVVKDPIFGNKTKKETYYISGTNQLKPETMIGEANLFPAYRVEQHQMLNPETGDTFMGKWLHLA